MTEYEKISLSDARAFMTDVLVESGAREDVAISVAKALVAAEAEGQVGHGFSRLADYAAQVRSGKIVADAVPTCTSTGPASLVVDAGHGFAYPALDLGIQKGIEVADSQGVASVAIKRSHHCGALSVQVDRIARAGLIGLMVANSPPAIAPWGAKEPIFGTNPIAFAAPRAKDPPLVIDLSLSRVARGKVMHAHKSGQPIPQGWALDANGEPTTDANAALNGSMIPIGEAKGTSLALMVEILAATFAGAHPSTDVSSFFGPDGPPPGSGQFLLLLKPSNPSEFTARIEPLLNQIAMLEGARLPGTRRAKAMDDAHRNGLKVSRRYLSISESP